MRLFIPIYKVESIGRGVAQLGSAPALGAGGPRFESEHPDHPIHPITVRCTPQIPKAFRLEFTPIYYKFNSYSLIGIL